MKNTITPAQADVLCRLIRDEFDNCPLQVSLSGHMEECIQLVRSLYTTTGLEQFLEAEAQMQSDLESDYPECAEYDDYDEGYPANVSPSRP